MKTAVPDHLIVPVPISASGSHRIPYKIKKYFLIIFLGLFYSNLNACPLCNSGTAKEVRNYLSGPALAENIVAIISPFLILFFILYIFNLKIKR